jgi:hypothetical protein
LGGKMGEMPLLPLFAGECFGPAVNTRNDGLEPQRVGAQICDINWDKPTLPDERL